MRILRLMGCDSRQFASMERYLVRACQTAVAGGHSFHVAYEARPVSEDFVRAIEAAGGELLVLGRDGSLPGFIRNLDKQMRRRRIDVLHAYFTPLCHYAMAYAWARGLRVRVRTSANMPLTVRQASHPLGPVGWAYFSLLQRTLALLPRRVFVLSQAMHDEFIHLGVRADRLSIISGGVDETFFVPASASERAAAREYFGLARDQTVVVAASRMVPIKGIDLLVEASAGLPGIRFVVAGDGPLRTEMAALATNLGVDDRVLFCGQLSDARVLFAAGDIFATPTRSEGLSNSTMESMASGLPVVASKILANEELVVDGQTGLLFPSNDPGSLRDAIARLAYDVELRRDYGQAGRRRIEDHFTVGRRVSQEIAMYESLLS
jgi:glycosyltransferase involved in cell wall biosynthesis